MKNQGETPKTETKSCLLCHRAVEIKGGYGKCDNCGATFENGFWYDAPFDDGEDDE